MAIRLGGIYALERIAKDSEKDHGPIMEVLTAYVRERAPRQEADTPEATRKPPTDIQAILTVIGRRKITDIKKFDDILDLSNTHLAGIVLFGANLSGVSLHGVNLSGALLIGTNLSGANLHEASLHGADLRGVRNLTTEQVRSAKSWEEASLPDYLDLSKPPDPAA